MSIERAEEERLAEDRDDELSILERNIFARLSEILLNKTAASGPKGMAADTKITQQVLDTIPRHQWWQIGLRNDKAMAEIEGLRQQYDDSKSRLDKRFADKVEKLRRGDELAPGVMKMVRVFVAVKRKLQPGDKMAGRHGNKGVISRIVPIEDMPHLEDGTAAEPHECRADPGNPSRLGLFGPWPPDRRHARQGQARRQVRAAAPPAPPCLCQ
jgi:DNA-directed RNA polymerase subunit beta